MFTASYHPLTSFLILTGSWWLTWSGVMGEDPPVFKSIATTIKTEEHDTVFLPCYVQNQGTNRVKWWKDGELIAVSYPLAALVDRVAIHVNNTLEVRDLRPADSGYYTCQVIREQPWGPLNQTHVITVLLPPKVRLLPEVEALDVERYKEVTLNCSVTGVPKPLITWTFNGEEIQLLSERNTLKILASSGKLSGEYTCIASNGVGNPASATINIRVIYPPFVTTPSTWLHTAPDMRTEIHCDVDASPKAKVEWLVNKEPVRRGTRVVAAMRGNRHSLIILKAQSSDFGFYTCLAVNSKGTGQQVIQLAGVPDTPRFNENNFQRREDNVTLVWQVESLSQIIQYNLLFRQYKNSGKPDNWTQLNIPADALLNGPLYDQTYTLTNLRKATAYESAVLARNVFGWSKLSPIFRFAMVGAEVEPHLTTEESTENNMINDYLPEYVTLETWESWKNSGNVKSGNVIISFALSTLLVFCKIIL